ncbi:hypothetical protein [Caenispirillum salinarum]|uniref:hypothetical protein n=1 Tax=Caenispirillum salinarum TaxID=859058 RepID=UPI00384B4E28
MSLGILGRVAVSAVLVGAFVVYFGTSLPTSIPDCHSNRGAEAIEDLAKDALGGSIEVGRVKETGRVFDNDGEIEAYTCKVAVQGDGDVRLLSVLLEDDDGAVIARQVSSLSP